MRAYLDNNATTMVAPEVLEAMVPYMSQRYGNPSSFHTFGSSVMDDVDSSRARLASALGASPGEIVFTSGGTESDNWALVSTMRSAGEGSLLVISEVEHPAVLETARFLESSGYRLAVVGVDGGGNIRMGDYRAALRDGPALVSIMLANNETGVLFPVTELASMAHERGALFHTDAVQAVGKIPVSVEELGVDLLSISAHKLHGPKGVGAIYIRDGVELEPFVLGGHQEHGYRAGTHNTPGIVGLGVAAAIAAEALPVEAERTGSLRDRLQSGILERCPGAIVVGGESERLPNTLSVLFSGVESESVLMLLDLEGVAASSGSACSTGSKDPSHVLRAMGVDREMANSAVRLSLSRYSTDEEIDHALAVLERAIGKLRSISPYS